jgi:hypothetical protein
MPTPSPTVPAAPAGATSHFPDPIDGLLPFGTLTLLGGAPGVGKTTLLAQWIAAWRDEQPICDRDTHKPSGFYYLSSDRGGASLRRWFAIAGVEADVQLYNLVDDRAFNLNKLQRSEDALDVLLEVVNMKLDPPPGGHLFLDPLAPLWIKGDPNKARDVAISLTRLTRLCQERFINITAPVHFSKQRSDPKDVYARPQDRISGSGAFAGFSDTQVYLCDPLPPAVPCHVLGWVPRHGPPEEFQLTRDKKTGLFVPYELYAELGLHAKLLECVPFEPTEAGPILAQMAEVGNLTTRTARKYLDKFVADQLVVKLRHGWFQRPKRH